MLETFCARRLLLGLPLLIETRIPEPLLKFLRTRRVHNPENFQTNSYNCEQGIKRECRSSEATSEEGNIVGVSKSLLEIIALLVNFLPDECLGRGQRVVAQRRHVHRHTVFPH